VKSLTATEAARNFSDVLDAVERDGESFVVVRRGVRWSASNELRPEAVVR